MKWLQVCIAASCLVTTMFAGKPGTLCQGSPTHGPCEILFSGFTFDGLTCKKFSTSGCGLTINGFRTKEECDEKCGICKKYDESCGIEYTNPPKHFGKCCVGFTCVNTNIGPGKCFYVCPRRFPQIEVHPNKKDHGDVCRQSSENKNYRCPKDCFKVPKGRPPFCQMSSSNKSPCRLVCEDEFPRLETFSNPSKHGNVCRKQNNNNYRCPRGCRKTENGLAPFCSTLNNPSMPCRNQ